MNTPSLRWLVGTAGLFVFLSWAADQAKPSSWLSSALLNIGSGILTSIVIVYSYDNLLARRSETERVERERRALSALKVALRQHFRLLLDCYRSASESLQAPQFLDASEFLGPHYHSKFAHLDIYAPSPSSSDGSVPYFQYIETGFRDLNNALLSTLAVSGRDLSQDVYLAMERVCNSDFMKITLSLSAICGLTVPGFGRTPSQLITGMESQITIYCAAFARLLAAMEKVHPQGLREYSVSDWHNAIFAPGHARRA